MRSTIALALAAGFLLAGCAPQIHSGNERGVIITNVVPANSKMAYPLADTHCKQHRRHAQLKQAAGNALIFDCVE